MLTEKLTDYGIKVNEGTTIKLVHTNNMSIPERLSEIKTLLIPTILNTTSVFDFNNTTIDITDSSNIFSGILYLFDILRGKAFVIKVYKK
ncbi:MAG: hypothetical protein R3321_04110 [Nitrososphaeraceae archaeon]|nr:hypothetical protein [Nitrososphaeraceae archaeon]